MEYSRIKGFPSPLISVTFDFSCAMKFYLFYQGKMLGSWNVFIIVLLRFVILGFCSRDFTVTLAMLENIIRYTRVYCIWVPL